MLYLYRYNMAMKLQRDLLLHQRQSILAQMQSIDRLRRGSFSQQFFRASPAAAARQGPYYVLQGFFHGRKFSERVRPEQAAQVEQDVENYRRFQTLAEEFVTVSDQITRLQDQPPESKKNSSLRKSPANSSRKPPLS